MYVDINFTQNRQALIYYLNLATSRNDKAVLILFSKDFSVGLQTSASSPWVTLKSSCRQHKQHTLKEQFHLEMLLLSGNSLNPVKSLTIK